MDYSLFPTVFPVLNGEGITLRELTDVDLPAWFKRLTDPEAAELAGDPIAESMEDVISGLEYHAIGFRFKESIRWAIVPDDIGESVGTIGFNSFNPDHDSADIGYAIGRSHWNKGIATRAIRIVINYGFNVLKLKHIEAEVLTHNVASIRVLEKLSFVKYDPTITGNRQDEVSKQYANFLLLREK
jgi:ribosomal-protein-alanine N-acetyltransferase